MKAVAPEQRIGDKKIAYFMATIIKNQGTPILMGSLAWILVLVQSGAVKARQCPIITRKMSGDPIDEDADIGFVER